MTILLSERKMKHRRHVVIASLIFAFYVPARGQEATSTGSPVDKDFGTIILKAKWPPPQISVCWENPTPADARYRAVVRRAIAETWEEHSSLRFVGWSRCTETSKGIRILIEDSHPHVKNVGKYLDGMPNGMVLNFDFDRWSRSCRDQRDFCAYSIAVHEFGHAIGFTHEQNRKDAPVECRAEAQGPDGDFLVTKYDPFSIMNYCNPTWNGDGRLSELDILSVRKIYGD